MPRVLKLSEWNSIIDQVNEVRANPPDDSDCEPLPPIEQYEGGSPWRRSEVERVQNALAATCPDISFESDLTKSWRQSWLMEITSKLSEAWCDCEDDGEPCPELSYTTVLQSVPARLTGNCSGVLPIEVPTPVSDLVPLGTSLLPEGANGSYSVTGFLPSVPAYSAPSTCAGVGELSFFNRSATTRAFGGGQIENGVTTTAFGSHFIEYGVAVFSTPGEESEVCPCITEDYSAYLGTWGPMIIRLDVTCSSKSSTP